MSGSLSAGCVITFTGQLPRAQVQTLLQSYNIFVFPVIWDEPFSIVLLEALQAGLAIVATSTGGTSEILQHEKNCLLIPPNDPSALATAIERLLTDTTLRLTLQKNATLSVTHFDLESRTLEIELHLQRIVKRLD